MTEHEGRAQRALREQREQEWAGLRDLLLPNEKLLCRTSYERADGKDLLEKPPDARSDGRKVAETAAGVILYPVAGSPPSLSRMLGGVSVAGQIGSWAHQLVETWRNAAGTNRGRYLAVTDQRLLLVSRKIWGKDPDWSVELEIPRNALAQVEMDSRPLARGRVALAFTDGSMIALKLGTYRTGTARTLVQALTAPGTVTPLQI